MRICSRMSSAISSTASGFQVAASAIAVGNDVKPGATTPFSASLWKIAGMPARVFSTRYRCSALTDAATSRSALRAEHADARDLADAAAERLLDGCGTMPCGPTRPERHDADELLRLLFDRQLRGEARGALVGGAGGGDVDAIHDESVLRCDQLV